MMRIQSPSEIYKARVSSGELKGDAVQEAAIAELQRLFNDALVYERASQNALLKLFSSFSAKDKPTPKGIYMHGGVGRGKSMLMDLFYETLPDNIDKRRVHFHEFMIEVHDYIHEHRNNGGDLGVVDQALPKLAQHIANQANILCFDEFHVVDITDAMILGRLFKILFEHGVIVVATSNWALDDLYKGGLQRDRFLPFIELLKTKVKSVHLDSPHDYRAQTIQIEGTYFYPLCQMSCKKMDDVFEVLSLSAAAEPDVICVKGRKIEVKAAANGVARFSFAQLCERPHGAEDYLEIAQKYHSVLIENIPKISYDRRNEAKRLINLIDALYEARTRVIISADAPVEQLYLDGAHAYEFERTASRLMEMQSKDYP